MGAPSWFQNRATRFCRRDMFHRVLKFPRARSDATKGSLRFPQLVYSTFIRRAIGGMWSVAAHFVDPNMSPHEAPLAFAFLASSSLSRFRARYRSFALNISEPVFWLLAF